MPRPKAQRNEIKFKYYKHEIVWAKIAGFPWWPATITCTPSKLNCYYKVDFIGDRSYAYLSESKITKYVQLRDQYEPNKKNNKNFLNAVTIAARKYQELLFKQDIVMKSKSSIECKTSQQKQQIYKQIELPQIQENIQQFSSQNQNKKNILQQKNKLLNKQIESFQVAIIQQEQVIQQQIKEPQQFKEIECEFNNLLSPVKQKVITDMIDQLGTPQLIQKNNQISIEALLVKYKLNYIPELKQIKNEVDELQYKKPLGKRKLIIKGKKYSKQNKQQFNDIQLLARKIYKFLFIKLQSISQSIQVTLNLQNQITKQTNNIKKQQYIKKLINWIQTSTKQHIRNYNIQWINFYKDNDRQRQKHSTITMQDDSQSIIIVK